MEKSEEIRKQRLKVESLKSEASKKERELDDAHDVLKSLESQCRHHWSEPIADHIYHPGGMSPGDPPGTMGVDWRGPTYYNARTEERWKRICKNCGKVESTSNVKKREVHEPDFGDR